MYVIAFGNAFDGLSLVGPFDSHAEAEEYANRCQTGNDGWTIVQIEDK